METKQLWHVRSVKVWRGS